MREGGAAVLVDVRRYPGLAPPPPLAREPLAGALPPLGVGYEWQGEALGGRRSRGASVVHLMAPGKQQPHALTDGVRAGDGGWPVYDVGVSGTLL